METDPNLELLVAYLTAIDTTLSRTVSTGKVLLTTSSRKKPSLLEGTDLAARIVANRREVGRLILKYSKQVPSHWFDYLGIMILIAYQSLDGLLPDGILRKWDYDPSKYGVISTSQLCSPEDLPFKLESFVKEWFPFLLESSGDAAVRHVADIEWEIGVGALHPFYDGCGRISRYFSALLSYHKGLPLRVHESRSLYMASASAGREAFQEYYLSLPAGNVGG